MSQQNDLGKVALTPKGAFNAAATYEQLDVVTYNGSSYLVLQTVTGVTPPNSAYYQTIASKGNNGTNGEAATITAGSISMLPLGSSPTVTNSGTPNSAVFNFGIPYSPVSDNSVTTSKIADTAVTTNKINNRAVTFGKLDDNLQEYFEVNAITPIAEGFSTANSYQTGDYVIFSGNNGLEPELYRFISNKPAGAWDASCVEFVNVCGELNKKVDSTEFGGAGINSKTYTTLFGGEFTVTTATDADHEHPWARSNVTGRLDKRYKYRVTFNGEQYILPSQLLTFATNDGSGVKVCEYLGDVSLYHISQDGTLNDTYSVGFLIVSDEDDALSIDIYTDVARDVVLSVERIETDVNVIGSELIYGDAYKPFRTNHVSSTYEMFSVGVNKMMETSKGGSAFGYNNSIDGNCGFAAGYNNSVTGIAGCAIGFGNLADKYANAEGYRTTASNQNSHSEGYITTASGHTSHAEGTNTIASGSLSHAEGDGCRALALGAHVQGGGTKANASQVYTNIFGVNNALTDETGKTVTIQRYNVDGTPFSNPKTRTLGKYAEVVGNGDSDIARSNARTLDWSGNEKLAGSLTLGLGTANEVTITPQQLTQLLALLNN